MPGPTYGKRLAKQTNRKQKKTRKARRDRLGLSKGGAFGGGRLSNKRRKQRSGKGKYKYVGMYEGSTRDAISGVPKSTRKRRANKAMAKAIRLKREEDLIRGIADPKPISVREYEARYGVDTTKREAKEVKRFKTEKNLKGQGKRLRYIYGRPLTKKDLETAKTVPSDVVRDREIKKLTQRVKGYDRLIELETKRNPNVTTDEEFTAFGEKGIFKAAGNNPDEIVKNKNARLLALRANRARDRAQLEALLKRRAQGDVVRYSRRLRTLPKNSKNKRLRKRLIRLRKKSKKEIKWRDQVNAPRIMKNLEARTKEEKLFQLSVVAKSSKKKVNAALNRLLNDATKVANKTNNQDLKNTIAALKSGKSISPENGLLAVMDALNRDINNGKSAMRTGKIHPSVIKFTDASQEALSYEQAAKEYGLNFAESFIKSPAGAAMLVIDLATLGKLFKIPARIATATGLRAAARQAMKAAGNVKNIRFQTNLAKEATEAAGQAGRRFGTKIRNMKPKPKATKEQQIDEVVSNMEKNPAGYTKESRDLFNKIREAEAKYAKASPKQRGGYRTHINKLRESLFQEIIKQPSFTRRVLAAPVEAARVSNFTFRSGSRAALSSVKAGVYRRRWLLGGTGIAGGIGLGVDAAINNNEITKNAWRDARDIATGLPYALYTSGKAGVAAVGGDWSYINAMWDTYKNTSPILLGIQGRWDEALESLKRRPISAALEVGGIYALAGRSASRIGQVGGSLAGYKPTLNPAEITDQINNAGRLGRVGIRMGVASQRLRAPDIFMVNSPGIRQRRYSKNLLTAMIEKRADKNRLNKENALIKRRVDAGRKKELEQKKDDEFTDADEKELAELATVKDLTPKEEKALKRIEKEREAAMLLMVDEYVDNAVSTLSLARRKVISDLEESLVAIPSRVSKEVGPGAEKALRLMASGSLGGPKTAVASAERLLAKAIEQRKSMRRNDAAEEAINLHIEQLKEVLKNKKYLTDPKMWDAVEELGKVMNPLEDELVKAGLLLPQQREFAPWIHYAIDQMGAKAVFKDKKVSWVVPEKNNLPGEMGEPGTVLSVKDIRAHAEASGFKGTPVFFSARELEGGPTGSSFDGSAPITYNESTLGKLIDGQRYDLSWEDVMRQAIGVKLNITRKNFYDNIVALWATGDSQGMTFGSATQAMNYFKENRKNYEIEMAALPIPGSVKKLDEDSLREELLNSKKGPGDKVSDSEFEDFLRNPTADVTNIFDELINNNGKFNFEVRYALVPAQLIKRLQDHAKSDAALNRGFVGAMNWANREFKGGVLPFSVAWHTGNIADMGLRMFMDGVGPTDAARGIRLAKYLEKNHPELYTRFLAEIGGGHLIDAKQSVLSRRDSGKPPSLNPLNAPFSSRQLADYEYRQLTAAQKIMYQVRIDQQLARKYRWAQRKAFGLGEIVEKNARFAVVGKQAKDLLEEMGYNWFDTMRLNGKMIEDLALGLDKQRNLQALGKATNKTLGDYTNMGPDMRLLVRTALPFGLWLRASARFMLTMPYRSPIKMAFFENVNRMTEAERRELGLYLLDDRQTVLPAYLQGSIPGGTEIDPRTGEIVNTFFRTQQYTSLGPFYDLSTLVDFVLPIWSGIDDPLSGVSWKGTELISTDGKPLTTWEKSGVMMTSLLETYLYPSQIFHKMLVGGTPADSSSLFPSVKKENWRWNPPWQTRKFMESIRQTFFPDAQRSYNIIGQGDYKKIVYEEARSTKDLFNPTGKKSLFNPFRPQQWTLDKNRQSGGRRSVLLGEREPAYGRYIKPDVQKKYGKRRKGGSGLLGTKPPSSGSGGSTLLGK